MANQIGKRPFINDAVAADAWCCTMAYLWIGCYECGYYLHQQYGAGHEFDHVVF